MAVTGGITLDKASFVGLILETLGFGIFNALFIATVYALFQKARSDRMNWSLLITLCMIWALTLAHWVVNVCRGAIAFVESQATPMGALSYYADLAVPLYAAKTAIYVMLTFVGDSFVAYRCWVVWGRKHYILILPAMMCLGTVIVGFIATAKFTQVKEGDLIFAATLVPWITSFIIMSLGTNVLCTFLIAARIVASQRRVAAYSKGPSPGVFLSSRISSVLIIIVESAGVYSAALISLVTVYLLDSNGQYAILDLTAPIIGITFSMIIIRVSLVDSGSKGPQSGSAGLRSWASGSRDPGRLPSASRAVAVNVTRLVEMNGDQHAVQYDSDTKSVPTYSDGGKDAALYTTP
ncbi:hypothetical protein BD626DRAFT_573030 [Schizophyllum amplum]|uniref:Uncharacterized protein n=1 Tax=Schizophyllum amplum TaxID=97359 RepID=A0A550C2H4_9AGAR|nr:hypothetical protein BD626DRAFT_573030 [Auriculariopsis ampla]